MKKRLLFVLSFALTAAAWMPAFAADIITGDLPTGKWSFDRESKQLYIDAVTIPGYNVERAEWGEHTSDFDKKCNPQGYHYYYYATDAPWNSFRGNIEHILLSPNVEKIGKNAFCHCYCLKDVVFSERTDDRLVAVDSSAFRDCWNLENFQFHYVKEIYAGAFNRTALKYVELTKVTYLGYYCFSDCPGLHRKDYTNMQHEQYNIEPTIRILTSKKPKIDNPITNGSDATNSVVGILIPYSQSAEYPKNFGLSRQRWLPGGVIGYNTKTGKAAYWYKFVYGASTMAMIIDFADTNVPMYANANVVPWSVMKNEDIKAIHTYNMNGVPPYAFQNFTNLETVFLDDKVITVNVKAFEGCTRLHHINLSNVLAIGDEAFRNCKGLTYAYMDNIIGIGKFAFENTSLNHIELGKDLNNLGIGAFYGIFGGDIYLQSAPPTGDRMGEGVFAHVQYAEHMKLYVPAAYATLYKTSAQWKEFPQEIDIEYPFKADGWQLHHTEADEHHSEGVTMYISSKAVLSKNYTSPEQTPWYAFRDRITSISIEKEAGTEIGDNAFFGMTKLRYVTMINGQTRIGKRAFRGCTSLYDVWFSDDNNDHLNGKIEDEAFAECKALKSIAFGTKLKSIGEKVFYGCGEEGLENIWCGAENPPALKSNSFEWPELIKVRIPQKAFLNYITDDNWSKFQYDDLAGEHGNTYTAGKFYNGYYILYQDGHLYCYATENTGTVDLFGENRAAYDDFVTSLEVDGSITYLGDEFAALPELKTVTLTSTIDSLGATFKNCKKLETVNMKSNNGVKLGDETFSGCSNLKKFDFGDVVYIGKQCFYYTGLTELKLTKTQEVGEEAFMGCNSMKYADLGNAKTLGNYLFYFCKNLEWARLNPISIQSGAFENCEKLTTVYLGWRVAILNSPFYKTALKNIYYTRPYPGAGAFSNDIFSHEDPSIAIDPSTITLYVPKASIDMYKKFDEWKDMTIKADPTLDEGMWTLPAKGVFFDENSHWELDTKGNLNVYVKGSMGRIPWYSDGFDPTYEHPLQIWMPYFSNVNIIGEDAKVAFYTIPGFSGNVNNYDGIKTITIGSGVDSLSERFCDEYRQLTDVYCYTENVPQGKNAFRWNYLNTTVIKPPCAVKLHVLKKAGVKEKFAADSNWKKFAEIIADLGSPTYMITLAANYGTIEVQESGVDLNAVDENTNLHFTAVPDDGFKFVRWENYNPSTGLTVTDNVTVTAIFEPEGGTGDMEVSYVCDFTKKATNHNNYNDTWLYDNTWNVFGGSNYNGGWDYVKMGGKSATLTDNNPVFVTNQTAFDKEIKQIRVTYPSGSFGKNGMSVNEWGVKVYSDLACTQLVSTVKGGEFGKDGGTLTLEPETGKPWSAGYALRVYWNLENSTSTNGIVWVSKIEYLTAKGGEEQTNTYTIRFLNYDGTVLQSSEMEEGSMPVYKGTKPTREPSDNITYIFTGWSPAITLVSKDADYIAQYSQASGIEEIVADDYYDKTVKVIIDGQLYIIRDGRIYNTQGALVK